MDNRTNNTISPQIKNKKNDDWNTPNWVWDCLNEYIPKDKIIWEAFYGNGNSGEYLKKLNNNVIHQDIDFFKNYDNLIYDIICSNPPFTLKKKILQKLKELEKPFMLLVPLDTIDRQYFQKIFSNDLDKLTLFFLPKRIDFINNENEYQPYRLSCIFIGYKVSSLPFVYLKSPQKNF